MGEGEGEVEGEGGGAAAACGCSGDIDFQAFRRKILDWNRVCKVLGPCGAGLLYYTCLPSLLKNLIVRRRGQTFTLTASTIRRGREAGTVQQVQYRSYCRYRGGSSISIVTPPQR